jgi:tetratricopeptide (TPR) repeat protein
LHCPSDDVGPKDGLEWLQHGPDQPPPSPENSGPPRATRDLADGRYRLERVIGEGGSGQVWQGFDVLLGRPVAVKRARTGHSGFGFPAEARRVVQLRHPGIVAVHDLVRRGDEWYIVSELVNGMDLRRHLLGGHLPVAAALRIAAEVAEALHHAHQKDLVHRDVKPANILLAATGAARLTDFGIAARVEELEDGNDGCGTVAYASPEQLAQGGPPLDHRTDVYSLGVVLYEMLTGERPAQGANSCSLRESISRGRPRPPRAVNPAIPREVERICLRCLAKSPDDRYATAKELATDLHRVLARLSRGRFWLLLAIAGITVALASYNAYLLTRSVFTTRLYNPHDYNVACDRGRDHLHRREFRSALSHFEAAQGMNPESVVGQTDMAAAHLGLGQDKEAIACCDKALRADPTFPKAHYLRGLALKRQGRLEEALEAFRLEVRCASPDSTRELEEIERELELRKGPR